MCRKVTGVVLLITFLLCNAANAQQYAFQVTFTDKANTPYTLSSPLAYLSARSLARRTTQHIAIDSTDLPVDPAYVDSVITLTGGIFHEVSRWLNMCVVLVADSSQILNIVGKPYISDIQLVGYYSTDLHERMAATGSAQVHRTTSSGASYYGDTWTQTHMVNGNYLHDKGYKGQGMLIAVLDAGFINADTHPGFDSMWSSGRVLDTFDFTFHGTGVFTQDGHGTQVLSTMAGNAPGGYVGTAPLASYALYITEKNPTDQPIEMDNMISAAERADSLGANVITESLGYDIFDYPPGSGMLFTAQSDGKTTVAVKAANMATQKGILFVATAGNDGQGYLTWGNHISSPGDADSALTIGNVDAAGTPDPTSGYGPNAAGRTKPDVCAIGDNAIVFYQNLGYAPAEGTSFSTPQIAGWAACLWQANPNATPYQVRQAIIKCASSYNSPGLQLGYGVPDFECTEQALNIKDTPLPFSAANWLIASPIPFSNELKIAINADTNEYTDITLMDITGKQLFTIHQFVYQGYNTPVDIATSVLPSGIYILKAASPTQQKVVKLEKL